MKNLYKLEYLFINHMKAYSHFMSIWTIINTILLTYAFYADSRVVSYTAFINSFLMLVVTLTGHLTYRRFLKRSST
jgi:hypothetical protein